MNTELVYREANKAYTTSVIISKNCDNRSHESTIKLIRKHLELFDDHGERVRFEIQTFDTAGGSQNREIAILNEDQATFLITLFRNTPTVLKFKSRLVKGFRKAIDEINRLYAEPPRRGILDSKRKAHSPMMSALEDFRLELGKETETKHYMTENKLCNFIVIGQFASVGGDENLTNDQAVMLEKVRRLNESMLIMGLDYSERKQRLIDFGIKYRTKLISKKGE